VAPFLDFREKWAIVLALTSNHGSADFQTDRQESSGEELWEKVLRTVQTWGTNENLMFVTGATHPQAFERIRQIVPDHFLLVPGVGAQGGDLHAICKHGLNDDCGLLVNASRSILYASDGEDFAESAHEEALRLQVEMMNILKERYRG
jgi:orotidine-5'-phosphate decarboxylase